MKTIESAKKWRLVFTVVAWVLMIPVVFIGVRNAKQQDRAAHQRWGPELVGILTQITGPITGSASHPYIPAIISFTDRNGNPGQTSRPRLVPYRSEVGSKFQVWQNPVNNDVFIRGDMARDNGDMDLSKSPYPSPGGTYFFRFLLIESLPILLYLFFASEVRDKESEAWQKEQSKGVTAIGAAA